MVLPPTHCCCLLLLVYIGLTGLTAFAAEPYFFADEFEGNSLDSKRWQYDKGQGRRWCGQEQNGNTPGTWVSMSTSRCYSTMQPPPFGSINVGKAGVHLASNNEYIFPYFFMGPPGKRSPFPASGDFILEIRLRHDYIGGAGNGVYVRFWDDTEPEGDNPPVERELRVFSIWSDQISSRIGLLGLTTNYPDIPGVFKVYRLEYKSGKYSAFINDILVVGPVQSSLRPNAIWVGNPIVLWLSNEEEGWTEFTIDYIRVSQPARQPQKIGKDS